jgi:hypothetical protein
MTDLFNNAVVSLRLGIEDFRANDPDRALSAVRNFYSGALLLAKEALWRRAPEADLDDVLAARYAPKPDGSGGVTIEPVGNATIDFSNLARRFKDFEIEFSTADFNRLERLGRIRNDIEHRYSSESHNAVKEAIGQAFPVVISLFQLCSEEASQNLGDCWATMLDIKEAFELERDACVRTFGEVEFPFDELAGHAFRCSGCGSELVYQENSENTDPAGIRGKCKSCGEQHDAEELIVGALRHKYGADIYLAHADGGEMPVGVCPECATEAYVYGTGCIWCAEVLGSCARCGTDITPDNASWDTGSLCSYCDYVMSKDD